jgi:hypothetical protein
MQAASRLGRGGSHNGSNQWQSDGSSYTNPSYGGATGGAINRHFRFDKQLRVRQLVQGQQHH